MLSVSLFLTDEETENSVSECALYLLHREGFWVN